MYAVYDYELKAARAALEAAKASRDAAEKKLTSLKSLKAHPLAIESQVHLAEAQYKVAVAEVAAARAKVDEVEAGPTAEQVAVAEAAVLRAQAQADALRTQIGKMTLYSPLSGMVTGRAAHPGEVAMAGATLLMLADLDQVVVVVYISEEALGRVYVGQEAEIRVDGLPGRAFEGRVCQVSQRAEFTPRNIQTEKDRLGMVFAVKVRVGNPEHLLKLGMPADVLLRE
jgi:multidrug resistance efflux pump